jgi:iron complex transport system permease protein
MRNANVVLRIPGASWRLSARGIVVAVIATLLLVAAVCVFTTFGTFPLSVGDVVHGVLGTGSRLQNLIVRELRLPRILEGVVVGALLGLSGAVFQSVSRNGLVSPDIIGVNAGAAVVAVFLISTGASQRFLPEWAFLGSLISATIVYLAAVYHGRLVPYRLILIGIAVNATLSSITTYLLLRSTSNNLDNFVSAQRWLAGSVDPSSWSNVRTLAIVLAVAVGPLLVLARRLDVMQLGDDGARSLGLRLELSRLGLVTVATLMAATAVAFAGPIAFIAFAAPHISRRLVAGNHLSAIVCAGLIGAVMLSCGDYVARRIIEPSEFPVGAVTTVMFCPYFLYLLLQSNRRGSSL